MTLCIYENVSPLGINLLLVNAEKSLWPIYVIWDGSHECRYIHRVITTKSKIGQRGIYHPALFNLQCTRSNFGYIFHYFLIIC